MDHKVKIKEEPVGLQEIASRPTSSPSADVKDELIIEEPTLDQLLPYFKEEEISSPDVSHADHPPPDGGRHLNRHIENECGERRLYIYGCCRRILQFGSECRC
ncbi:uncharacterized protein [Anabrus simplex]|uniref:uncharacterized protein isoform X2 n=1 Tax=Anabrus simplex TaxID=316456 RepID=UPI0035A3943A